MFGPADNGLDCDALGPDGGPPVTTGGIGGLARLFLESFKDEDEGGEDGGGNGLLPKPFNLSGCIAEFGGGGGAAWPKSAKRLE